MKVQIWVSFSDSELTFLETANPDGLRNMLSSLIYYIKVETNTSRLSINTLPQNLPDALVSFLQGRESNSLEPKRHVLKIPHLV
jgi:hypothetical protein